MLKKVFLEIVGDIIGNIVDDVSVRAQILAFNIAEKIPDVIGNVAAWLKLNLPF